MQTRATEANTLTKAAAAEETSISIGEALGTSNTVLLVTGLMLPVGGALARLVTIGFSAHLPDYARLAVTLPPAELATVGAFPITIVALALAMGRTVPLLFRSPRRLELQFLLLPVVMIVFTILFTPWVGLGATVAIGAFYLIAIWLGIRERIPSGEHRQGPRKPVRGRALVVTLITMLRLRLRGVRIRWTPWATIERCVSR